MNAGVAQLEERAVLAERLGPDGKSHRADAGSKPAARFYDLEQVGDGVIIRPMITVSDAIDLFDGHLAGLGRTKRTRDNYARTLDKFADCFPRRWDIAKVTVEDCESFLARWRNRSLGTQAQVHAPLAGLFRFLYKTRRIKQNPMEFVPTPRRQSPEDLDVLTVNPLDVPNLLRTARPGSERNCLFILASMGPRRHAAALLRIEDYDRRSGVLRFREKGGKTIWKPMPGELRSVLDASIANGEISASQPYLIPPEGPLVRKGERDDRVVWRLVKRVAERCGIEAHTHALRAAFACYYLLENPGDRGGLQELLGHRNPATTEVYLRKFDKRLAMEPVRALSWLGNAEEATQPQTAEEPFASSSLMGAGGFEPPFPLSELVKRAGTQRREVRP